MQITRIFIIISILSINNVYGQEKAQKLFDKGLEKYAEDKRESIEIFKTIITNHRDSKLYSISIYNVAQIYAEIDSIEQAKYWFAFALTAKFKDNIDWYNFPDTHSNIRHKSAHDLGHLYYKNNDYKRALEYYYLALNEYPYYSTSGTSTKKNNIKVRRWIADCYIHLGEISKAINVLLPDAITESPWAQNPVAKEILELIDKEVGREQFLTEFNAALSDVKAKKEYFSITMHGEDIKIFPYATSIKNLGKEQFINGVREREFYQSLIKNK